MKNLKYLIYRESDYYVSQYLNIEVASFGNSIALGVLRHKWSVFIKIIGFYVATSLMN